MNVPRFPIANHPMAGPSAINESHSLLALRPQLEEAGAGEVNVHNFLDLPQHADPCPTIQEDAVLTSGLFSESLTILRDAVVAHHLSSSEMGHASSE